jgi:hypothetical protein
VDYNETFAPVFKYASIRVVISIALVMRWGIHQMDMKTTLLNGIIEGELYIEKPQLFEVHGRGLMCVGLRKPYMDSNRHLGHGISVLTDTCRVWDLPRVIRSYLVLHTCWV